jgi:FkbM family methyltransferase
VDVGAFVGNHSVFFAKYCKADRVVAFEPFPETYRLLDHNIRLNQLTPKITAINKAVSDEPGSLTMSIVSKKNRGMNRIDADGRTRVEVTTLDSELADNEMPIHFLKIDTEGYGSKVIQGAESILRRHKPVIVVEVDPEPLADISDLLHQFGYMAKSCHNDATPTWIFEHEEIVS